MYPYLFVVGTGGLVGKTLTDKESTETDNKLTTAVKKDAGNVSIIITGSPTTSGARRLFLLFSK